jgi:two-component sensor histidine kinase
VNIFAVLSFISFILFVEAGIYALVKDSKTPSTRVFALLSFLFAIYSGSYTMFFAAVQVEQVYYYDRIASISWVFFPLVATWFFLLLTKTRSYALKLTVYFFLIPIAIYSYYVALTDLESVKFFYMYENNWYYTPYDTTLSYFLFVLYLITSVLICYYVLITWYFMAVSNRERHQAKIILYVLTLFFVLTFFSNLVFPFMQSKVLPAMAPINAIVLVGGVLYILFMLPSSSIAPNIVYNLIVQNVKEFIFIADSKLKLQVTNYHTLKQLQYNNYEIGKSALSDIFSEVLKIHDAMRMLEHRNVSNQMRMDLIARNGDKIPVLLYIIKVSDNFHRVQGYVLSCLDYRQKLKLRDEVAERIRTEKNLSQLRRELELLVKKRTRELHEANMRLQQEVAERRNAEEQIKADLHEKVKLVQEVHHRVKNNIQMIISLVNMLSRHPKIDTPAGDKLREIAEKVRYISRIHEDFYASPNLSSIAFSPYLKKAIGELYSNYGRGKDIVFKLNLADEMLDISQALPLGIIFNELLLNSLTYAFKEERSDKNKSMISVEFFKLNGFYSLILSDNGIGLQTPLHELISQNIGLQLVSILTKEHLKGTLTHYGQHGTRFIIRFSI